MPFRYSEPKARRARGGHLGRHALCVLAVSLATSSAAQAQAPRPLSAILLDHLCAKTLLHNEEDRLYGIFSIAARATIKYDGGVYSPDVVDAAVQNSALAIKQSCPRLAATDDPHKLGTAIAIVQEETVKLIHAGKADHPTPDMAKASAADLSQELSSHEIDTWLDGLDPQQRALAVFLYASNVSREDIAMAIGLPPAAVSREMGETKTNLLRFFSEDSEGGVDIRTEESPIEYRPRAPRHVTHVASRHRRGDTTQGATTVSASPMEFTISSGKPTGGASGAPPADPPDAKAAAADPAAPKPMTRERRETAAAAQERREIQASARGWREAGPEGADWREAAAAAQDRREIRMAARGGREPEPGRGEWREASASAEDRREIRVAAQSRQRGADPGPELGPVAAPTAPPPVAASGTADPLPLAGLLAPGRPEKVKITGISTDVYGGWSLLAIVTGLPRQDTVFVTEPFLLVPDQPGHKRMIVTGIQEISQPGDPARRFLLKAFSIDGGADAPGVNVTMSLGEAHIANAQAVHTLQNRTLSNIETTRCLWRDYGTAPDPGLCR